MANVEPLYVLYGSQMGNSEQAAKNFCAQLEEKYTPDFFKAHDLPPVQVQTTCIQLDDFLEMKHAAFTKCIVIFVSSYGVGQAPLGAYRFREICEAFSKDEANYEDTLKGLKYAICGLGDSTYPTKFKNPGAIDGGLAAAGAKRIGDLANADADGRGDQAQDKTIAKWIDGIWIPLAKAICADEEVDTEAMQSKTIPLLMKLDPDYTPPKTAQGGNGGLSLAVVGLAGLSLLGIVIAVAAANIK